MIKIKKEMRLHALVSALGILGMAMMSYLLSLHYSGEGSAVCDFGSELSCQVVNISVFSELFGIPLALLGVIYFLTIAILPWQKKINSPYVYILLFSIFSLVFGLYLSGIEWFVLNSICIFCEGSKVLMVILISISAKEVSGYKEKIPVSWILGTILIGILFSTMAYFMQRTPPQTEDYSNLTQCLQEKGVAMYSAYWCPQCARQKAILGDAFKFIDEIECDPRGENSQTERCIARKITKTPTWIEEKDGEEIKRLIGAHEANELADYFECPL